jgi:hypothetical protein
MNVLAGGDVRSCAANRAAMFDHEFAFRDRMQRRLMTEPDFLINQQGRKFTGWTGDARLGTH